MLTIGLVMLARRSASTAAACLRNPRCPTAPTGPLPSAAAVVLSGPPPLGAAVLRSHALTSGCAGPRLRVDSTLGTACATAVYQKASDDLELCVTRPMHL
jgi:hypothetical protein